MSVFSASVIIPAFRNLNDLRACIEALSRQDTLESYEIIVVSDAPDSDVRALLDSCNTERSVTYLYNSSRSGPAAARNLGARMALGDVLCFTEDDCVPDAHWLDGGIKLLRETGSDVVWGVLNGSTGDVLGETVEAESAASKTFVSANFFVKRSVFERIGGFDTRFNIDSSHDSDLFLRLKSSETRMCFIPVAHVESALRNRGLRTALTTARGSMFDVLLEQKHGTAAYAYTSRHLLSFFVLLNSILACSIAAYFAGTSHVALLFMALWFAGTVQYTSMRVRRSGVSPFGLFEVLITSAIIPTLVILWRAIGYIYFWLLAPSVQPLTLQTARSGT